MYVLISYLLVRTNLNISCCDAKLCGHIKCGSRKQNEIILYVIFCEIILCSLSVILGNLNH